MFKDLKQQALDYHEFPRPGKTAIATTKPTESQLDLSLAYTPGVAAPVREIAADPAAAYRYTNKGNLVAVITNGTAVLGLGDVGALAGKPVMEGKAVLFKRFADIDVFDIEVNCSNPEEFINIVESYDPTSKYLLLIKDINSLICPIFIRYLYFYILKIRTFDL